MAELNVFPDKVPDPINNTPQIDMGGGVTPSELEQLKAERLEILKKRDEANAKIEEELLAKMEKENPVVPKIVPISKPVEKVEVKTKRLKREKDYDAPFDLVPLPSKGLIYKHKKDKIRTAFLNGSDENILTAPHLMESGEFLDILFERKIIDDLVEDPKDLHSGDRDAIMIWLRATAYGNDYPIEVFDPIKKEFFESVFDLSTLKVKNLGATPDAEGLFDYTFERAMVNAKFKLLTYGEIEEIDEISRYELSELKLENANNFTNTLERHLVEVDGNRDREYIKKIARILPIMDSKKFAKYVAEISSGIDMNITVQVPGGGSVNTTFPFNRSFFWPEF